MKQDNARHIKNKNVLQQHEDCVVEWAMLAFYEWNKFLEKIADYRFRIETFDPNDIAKRAGLQYRPRPERACLQANRLQCPPGTVINWIDFAGL